MKLIKPMMVIACVLWISLILHIFFLEIIGFRMEDMMVTGIITISLLVMFYIYYFYLYFKNKQKVAKLKQEYLDSLKPTKPLLFCPTDEELEKKYYGANLTKQKKQKALTKVEEENTDDEELVME